MANIRVTFLGTGAGNCIHRAHTAIVLDCSDGTRLLLDTGSGNSLLRNGAVLGIMAEDFGPVLLTHRHADHLGGLPFLQGQRTLVDPDGPPLDVYGPEETLEWARRLCQVHWPSLRMDHDGAWTPAGQQVLRWSPTKEGHWLQFGRNTRASSFIVDHIPGSVGWRVESSGLAVVFSGDTKFSPNVVQAAQGARLLIHEALTTEDGRVAALHRDHSTAADAARTATLAGVAELVMTHIDTPFHFDSSPLLVEARHYFDGPTSIASDLQRITVATA